MADPVDMSDDELIRAWENVPDGEQDGRVAAILAEIERRNLDV